MIRLILSLTIFGGCSAIRGCFTPNIPNPPTDSGAEDTQETGETGETGDTAPVETAPPPPCTQPEVEPNYNGTTATAIDMEAWACGVFGEQFDFDVFEFELEESGWLEVEVQAVSRGSVSNVVMTLESEGGMAAASERGPETSDPYLLVPAPAADTWLIRLTDAYQGYGEDYDYRVMASASKPPLSWDAAEAQDHNSIFTAQTIEADEVIYGTIDSATGFDWYHIRIPEGRWNVSAEVMAHSLGSPLLPRLQLYFIDEDGEEDYQSTVDESPDSASLDPRLERISGGGEDWYFKVRYRPDQRFGDLYWYAFQITLEEL